MENPSVVASASTDEKGDGLVKNPMNPVKAEGVTDGDANETDAKARVGKGGDVQGNGRGDENGEGGGKRAGDDGLKENRETKQGVVPISKLFSYSDGRDKVFMVVGTFAACVQAW